MYAIRSYYDVNGYLVLKSSINCRVDGLKTVGVSKTNDLVLSHSFSFLIICPSIISQFSILPNMDGSAGLDSS